MKMTQFPGATSKMSNSLAGLGWEIDKSKILASDLDAKSRSRLSAFPWRGQFTPDLVELLFDEYDSGSGLFLDPFVGSGTTISESIRRKRPSVGVEVNPAALELSAVFTLANLPISMRNRIMNSLESIVEEFRAQSEDSVSFPAGNRTFAHDLAAVVRNQADLHTSQMLSALLLLACGDKDDTDLKRIEKALNQIREVILDLPSSKSSVLLIQGDARDLPVVSNSVGFILTSPPYINVFNYHQNYRSAVELLGWDVLPAARAEIGSNRKHRQNRFLTVIQYALDMALALNEMQRVLSVGSNLVIVVGRESRVRGISFGNAEIIGAIIKSMDGLEFQRWHERKFTSRYGQLIYEEILVFKKASSSQSLDRSELLESARRVAHKALVQAKNSASGDVAHNLDTALESLYLVQPSQTPLIGKRESA